MSIDITSRVGELFPSEKPAEWPMYSFSRPAWLLWNAIANALIEKGWTEDEIKFWLQSKDTRWALDGSLGESIVKLGREYAQKITK